MRVYLQLENGELQELRLLQDRYEQLKALLSASGYNIQNVYLLLEVTAPYSDRSLIVHKV